MSVAISQRSLALDVLRGMTVCFMIIVNTPGSWDVIYPPLEHASWHGFTPTDLVFPSFLFVVGNAMSFALPKYESMGSATVIRKILKRTIIIFLLGFLISWFPFFHFNQEGNAEFNILAETRIMGVLQRIALCYGISSLMIHFLPSRTVIISSIVILLGYWAALLIFGNLTLEGNAVLKLDKWLLGERHLYHGEGIAFDPEGLLSTLPAIVNVIAGYYAGVYLQKKGKSFEAVSTLLIAGFASLVIAYFWDLVFPINKKLWTSSYVLYTVGLSLIILGSLVYFIDIKNWKKGTYFFEVFGRNPLFIYLLADLFAILFWMVPVGADKKPLYSWIHETIFQNITPGKLGSFLFAIAFMLLCWSVGLWLDKRKIYIKV
jgi:predicted acyltransferase